MTLINTIVARIRNDEDGQGLAEYALILALIAIVAIVALIFLGGQVSTILSTVGTRADPSAAEWALPHHAFGWSFQGNGRSRGSRSVQLGCPATSRPDGVRHIATPVPRVQSSRSRLARRARPARVRRR